MQEGDSRGTLKTHSRDRRKERMRESRVTDERDPSPLVVSPLIFSLSHRHPHTTTYDPRTNIPVVSIYFPVLTFFLGNVCP